MYAFGGAAVTCHSADIDHAATPGMCSLKKVREDSLERQEGTVERDRHDFSPVGVIDCLDLCLAPERRVVDQNVNAAESSNRFCDSRRNGRRIPDVSCHHNGPPAFQSNQPGRLFSFFDGSARVDSNISTTLRQGKSDRASDVPRGPGDESNASL
jgi:hypothetical protein